MIGLIGLAAFFLGCLICFLLGHKLGSETADHTEARYIAALAELDRVKDLNSELTKTLDLHRELITHAAPILEEHTWHKLGFPK